jgi:hypothetical protein
MSEPIFEKEAHRLGFLELFQEESPVGQKFSHVEIPLIQRDYAQGRKSSKAVRDQFLDSLLTALKNDRWLSLDFIYGEVVKAENNQSYFQPIDGQQRLTTLFLLHWYLACVAGRREDFAKWMQDGEKEPRFQYSVRKSSQQFFAWLLDFTPDLSQSLAEQLSDQAWSFGAWQHDSTIQGALEMLEAIREKFAGQEAKEFYDKLQQPNRPITLDVLNLEDLGLSDEIYIKMNARGKELTGFEKFKAWLIGDRWETNRLSWADDGDEAKQWPILLDGDWLDLFWAFRDRTDQKPSESVSRAYFRTFLALAVNFHASKGRSKKEWRTADCDDQQSLWGEIFTEEALQSVFLNLRNLSSHEDAIGSLRKALKNKEIPFSEEPLCKPFFEGGLEPDPPGLKERLWLHAICLFLEALHECDRDDWFRVIRNLIENSTLRDETFANAVQSISILAQNCLSQLEPRKNRPVLSALQNLSFLEELKGLDGKQKEEESEKATRILRIEDGSEWEKAIVEAENHSVLRGQIGLLLDEDTTLDLFQQRWAVFNKLLDDKGSKIGRDRYLLARAALTQCEPIILGWQQNLEFNDAPGHWKYLLGSDALEPESQVTPKGKFRKGMQKLVNHLIGSVNFESDMSKLLQGSSVDKDWMDDVIRYGHIFLQWRPDIWNSREHKVQSYGNNGTFIYRQKNSANEDIMLGTQAHWRNSIIKSLLVEDVGLDIDEWRKVPGIDADPPFYRGHQFPLADLNDKRLPWQVSIRYRCVLLEKRNTDSSQSSGAEGRPDSVEFEYPKTTPEQIVERIKEKIKSWQSQIDLQP